MNPPSPRKPESVSSEEHFARAEVVREYASFDFLLPPEGAILEILADELPGWRVLDLGVGGGRTSRHLAGRVREYVGVDYSPAMIQACEEHVSPRLSGPASFRVADARDLREFESGSFDFVLFSFQGLDSIADHTERLQALREIRRVLREEGWLAFSSDNLAFLRELLTVRSLVRGLLSAGLGSTGKRRPSLRRLARHLGHGLRRRRLNSEILTSRAPFGRHVYLRPPYELSPDGFAREASLIEIDGYAIEPAAQVSQLESVGYDDVRLFTWTGKEAHLGDRELLRSQWVYYLCRKRGDGDVRSGNSGETA